MSKQLEHDGGVGPGYHRGRVAEARPAPSLDEQVSEAKRRAEAKTRADFVVASLVKPVYLGTVSAGGAPRVRKK
jgi:hypothetical protein